MKSITTKLSALLLTLAVSFPAVACPLSNNAANHNGDTDTLSIEMVQRISNTFNEASF